MVKKIKIITSKKYDILMESGLLSKAGPVVVDALSSDSRSINDSKKMTGTAMKLCIVADENTAGLYDNSLQKSLKETGFKVFRYTFTGGESSKSMKTIESLLDFLTEHHFTRTDLLLALGGGVVGDITGFTAAIYLRGIRFIQVPTTLLACVDSSIGGKTGVNLKAGKNLAGAFWQPELVLIDPDVFRTLTYATMLDGLAEIIKAGMISDCTILSDLSDPNFSLKDEVKLTEIMVKAIMVKQKIVMEDEREKACRQLLNFGHTAGHAIEKCSGYRISHGMAVATGCAIESAAADALGWSSVKCAPVLLKLLRHFGISIFTDFTAVQLAQAALSDKKMRGERISLVYPDHPGKCLSRPIPFGELEIFFNKGIENLKKNISSPGVSATH